MFGLSDNKNQDANSTPQATVATTTPMPATGTAPVTVPAAQPANDYVSPYLSNFTLYENPTEQTTTAQAVEPQVTTEVTQIGSTINSSEVDSLLKSYNTDVDAVPSTPAQIEPQVDSLPVENNPVVVQQDNNLAIAPSNESIAPSIPQVQVPTVNDVTVPTIDPSTDLNKEIKSEEVPTLNSETEEKVNTILDNNDLDIKELLDLVIENNGSDLHLSVGYPIMIRVDDVLERAGEPLTSEQVKSLIFQTLNTNQKELLEINKEVDLSYPYEDKARFRVNAYYQQGDLAASYRLIPSKIKTIEDLLLPNQLFDFTRINQGLFLVSGPTGSGKSTTLAAMIQEINENYAKHIITIEDPIEYVYPKGKALVDQRELGSDTHDWNIALKSILRQDPDVILIGELRDFETIQSALTIAETGHLVFATLHTNSAAETIDRIVDVFPAYQQSQVRLQLASTLKGVLAQRLLPKIGGGREAATELMIVNSAIQNLIRDGKSYQIDNVISTSFDLGMTTLERSLVKKVREGKISVETALEYSIRPKEVLKLMRAG